MEPASWQFKVIELSKFHKTPGRFSGTQPWCMAWVYTPVGNFFVKGMSQEVDDWIEKNVAKGVYNKTYWLEGKSRNYWGSTRELMLYFRRMGSHRHVVSLFREDGTYVEVAKTFRRIPHKWIPLYDEACIKMSLSEVERKEAALKQLKDKYGNP